jgi:hypothetical protein
MGLGRWCLAAATCAAWACQPPSQEVQPSITGTDGGSASDGSNESTSSSTTGDGGSGTSASSTTADSTTSTSSSASATTGGDDTGGSTGTSEGSTGNVDPVAYGPCLPGDQCEYPGEVCIRLGDGVHHLCTTPCNIDGDCPPPPAGTTAPVSCVYVGGQTNMCMMDCTQGQCATPLVCNPANDCSWN